MKCETTNVCNVVPPADIRISVKCNGCQSGGNICTNSNNKDMHFFEETPKEDEYQQVRYKPAWICHPKKDFEVCLCCREGDNASKERKTEKSVLFYELPEPKFDDMTIHRRDFCPKPLPNRELPPWHPIRKDRWKSINVPSLKKSIYQRDYTPPIRLTYGKDTKQSTCVTKSERKEYHKKEHESYFPQEQSESLKIWRKTSEGPDETIEVCDKPQLQIQETEVTTRRPDPASHHHHTEASKYREELHDPACEKHCYSTPLMCHVRPAVESKEQPTVKEVAAALTIEKKHMHHGKKKVHFAPEACRIAPLPHEDAYFQGDLHTENDRRNVFSEGNGTSVEQANCELTPQKSSTDVYRQQADNDRQECPRTTTRDCFRENNTPLSNCSSACSNSKQIHHRDGNDHSFSEFPLYPGKSPVVHTEQNNTYLANYVPISSIKDKNYHTGPDRHGPNNLPMSLFEPQAAFLEDNVLPPKKAVNFSNCNPNGHHNSGKKNPAYEPYHSGCFDADRSDSTFPNTYPQSSPGENFETKDGHSKNHDTVNSRSNQMCNSDSGDHCSENPNSSDRYNQCSNNPKESSKFTLCADTKPSNSKWWKIGCSDSNREKLFATEDVSLGVIKPCCPPYLTITSQDFKQPNIDE